MTAPAPSPEQESHQLFSDEFHVERKSRPPIFVSRRAQRAVVTSKEPPPPPSPPQTDPTIPVTAEKGRWGRIKDPTARKIANEWKDYDKDRQKARRETQKVQEHNQAMEEFIRDDTDPGLGSVIKAIKQAGLGCVPRGPLKRPVPIKRSRFLCEVVGKIEPKDVPGAKLLEVHDRVARDVLDDLESVGATPQYMINRAGSGKCREPKPTLEAVALALRMAEDQLAKSFERTVRGQFEEKATGLRRELSGAKGRVFKIPANAWRWVAFQGPIPEAPESSATEKIKDELEGHLPPRPQVVAEEIMGEYPLEVHEIRNGQSQLTASEATQGDPIVGGKAGNGQKASIVTTVEADLSIEEKLRRENLQLAAAHLKERLAKKLDRAIEARMRYRQQEEDFDSELRKSTDPYETLMSWAAEESRGDNPQVPYGKFARWALARLGAELDGVAESYAGVYEAAKEPPIGGKLKGKRERKMELTPRQVLTSKTRSTIAIIMATGSAASVVSGITRLSTGASANPMIRALRNEDPEAYAHLIDGLTAEFVPEEVDDNQDGNLGKPDTLPRAVFRSVARLAEPDFGEGNGNNYPNKRRAIRNAIVFGGGKPLEKIATVYEDLSGGVPGLDPNEQLYWLAFWGGAVAQAYPPGKELPLEWADEVAKQAARNLVQAMVRHEDPNQEIAQLAGDAGAVAAATARVSHPNFAVELVRALDHHLKTKPGTLLADPIRKAVIAANERIFQGTDVPRRIREEYGNLIGDRIVDLILDWDPRIDEVADGYKGKQKADTELGQFDHLLRTLPDVYEFIDPDEGVQIPIDGVVPDNLVYYGNPEVLRSCNRRMVFGVYRPEVTQLGLSLGNTGITQQRIALHGLTHPLKKLLRRTREAATAAAVESQWLYLSEKSRKEQLDKPRREREPEAQRGAYQQPTQEAVMNDQLASADVMTQATQRYVDYLETVFERLGIPSQLCDPEDSPITRPQGSERRVVIIAKNYQPGLRDAGVTREMYKQMAEIFAWNTNEPPLPHLVEAYTREIEMARRRALGET